MDRRAMMPTSWQKHDGLAALFAGLLAGCVTQPSEMSETNSAATGSTSGDSGSSGSSGFVTTGGFADPCSWGCCGGCSCYYDSADVLLSLAEYAMWVGDATATTTGDPETTTSDITTTTVEPATGTTLAPASSSTTDTGESTGGSSTTGAAFGPYDGTELTPEVCVALCQFHTEAFDWELGCTFEGVTAEERVHLVCTWTTGCDGRRHNCLRSTGYQAEGDSLTDWLARVTHDEAGSVHAFIALRRELAAYSAPSGLLRRLRRAAAEERRHTRMVDRLVRARGGRWTRPVIDQTRGRSLREIACENAVEGCVRETWAALSAAHQARHAEDPRIRATMIRIAADEARHAELAWSIDAWLRVRIPAADWALVEVARADAANQLRAGLLARSLPRAVVEVAGVPDRDAAQVLFDGLAGALWSL